MSSVGTLYVEELKALTRGRFAWLGAAVILLAVGGLAAAGTQDTWVDGYGIIAYFLVPLAFIPFAAGLIASPRANRFVESVFTAPVRRGEWLAAKILVLFTLALGYFVALQPMMLVYVANVGAQPWVAKFTLWCAGLLISSIAVGTLIGVLFIGRSVAAPVATAVGVLLAYAGMMPLQQLLVSGGNGASRTAHLTLASPAVLLMNAIGFGIASTVPASTARTWLSLGVLVVGSLALAAWVFLRAQGVESWEATRAQRWGITVALVVLFLFPTVVADTNYDNAAPALNNGPVLRGFGASATPMTLTMPGQAIPQRCCSAILDREFSTPISTNTQTRLDLVVLLPVSTSQTIDQLSFQIAGDDGLQVTADPSALANATTHLEQHAYANGQGPTALDGTNISNGWTARIPVTLDPSGPWDIGGVRYPLNMTASYHVAGDNQTRTLAGRGLVEALVGPALYEMSAAALPIPLVCLGAFVVRWRRTR